MLWNYHDEYPQVCPLPQVHRLISQWIYPFASSIDMPDLAPPKGADFITIKRDSCPESLPIPEGSKAYSGYGPGEGIEVCPIGKRNSLLNFNRHGTRRTGNG
jgi:hypothetical protein